MNNVRPVFSGLCHSPILRRAALGFVALAWNSLDFGSEIHEAAKSGDLAKLKTLLKDNPDLAFSKDDTHYGDTPLHCAAQHGQRDAAEWLLASKAEVSVHDAARKGDLEQVQALLKGNPDLVFNKDTNRWTPLHRAAIGDYRALAEMLLSNKANADAKDDVGRTPLHLAAGMGHQDLTEVLLANQAEVNAKNDVGRTPLRVAAVFDREDVAEVLRQHGGRDLHRPAESRQSKDLLAVSYFDRRRSSTARKAARPPRAHTEGSGTAVPSARMKT